MQSQDKGEGRNGKDTGLAERVLWHTTDEDAYCEQLVQLSFHPESAVYQKSSAIKWQKFRRPPLRSQKEDLLSKLLLPLAPNRMAKLVLVLVDNMPQPLEA